MLSTHFPYNAMMMMQPQFSTKAEVQGGTLSPPSSKATSAVSPQSIANMEEVSCLLSVTWEHSTLFPSRLVEDNDDDNDNIEELDTTCVLKL